MPNERTPAELARICRQQAALTQTRDAREALLTMAAAYERKARIEEHLVSQAEQPNT